MIHKSVNNLVAIEKEIQLKKKDVRIIAVSKTFPINQIYPLINHGHKHYGENKVQEAIDKWTDIKSDFEDIKLHLIGKLQTNKVKFILPLFDYIHSLDNTKLAEKISIEQQKKKFKPKIFVQVNIGNEPQKSGIDPANIKSFVNNCTHNLDLNIIGLMCIPPINTSSIKFFEEMNNLKNQNSLTDLSMGMSNDYIDAINNDASFVRIGSKIFGSRD